MWVYFLKQQFEYYIDFKTIHFQFLKTNYVFNPLFIWGFSQKNILIRN